MDQEGLADGFVRIRVTFKPSVDNGFLKLRSVCLAYAKDGFKFSDGQAATSVPTKALQSACDDVSVKVNLAYRKHDADAAEGVKKHLALKARISEKFSIQPCLMAITRAGLPILKEEIRIMYSTRLRNGEKN